MGISFIKGQSIEFIESNKPDFNTRNYECKGDPRRFCQIVSDEYLTQFQIKLDRASDENLITNNDFAVSLTDWGPEIPAASWDWVAGDGTGGAQGTATGNTTVSLYQDFGVTGGNTYEIVVNIYSISNGVYFYVGADSTGSDPAGTFVGPGSATSPITQPGIYTLYYTAGYTGTIDFFLRLVNPLGGAVDRFVVVNRVDMYDSQLPTVTLSDCDGNEVAHDGIEVEIIGDYANVTVDWTGLAAGCYKICVWPEDNPNENLLAAALCLTTESGEPITDEYGDCITIIP